MKVPAIALAATAALASSLTAQASDDNKHLVTVMTAPEPQTQLMGMVLSMQALQQGASVHMLLCGPAADLALKSPPASATAPQKPKGMSPQGLMKQIIAKGGEVQVCAIYLPNKGITAEALLDKVSAAKPPEMARRLMADDTRIMSF